MITHHVCYDSGSQNVFPGPAVSVSPGNLLEMQIILPHGIPTESESPELELSTLYFNQPSR